MTIEELKKYKSIAPSSFPIQMKEIEKSDKYGIYSTGIFSYKGMNILITIDDGFWHLSVSAKYPLGYQQLKDVRYKFLPNDMHIAQLFPPREEFVNVHECCWHLWEIKDREV